MSLQFLQETATNQVKVIHLPVQKILSLQLFRKKQGICKPGKLKKGKNCQSSSEHTTLGIRARKSSRSSQSSRGDGRCKRVQM